MAARGSTFINDYLKLIFNAVDIANIADNAASSPLTNLYASLHTATPTAGGNQESNECDYGGYARVAIVRSASGFTVTGTSVHPLNNIVFPTVTSGSGSASYVGIGTAASGAGKLLYFGHLGSSISIAVDVVPTVKNTSTDTET